jgi:hypothetical protein
MWVIFMDILAGQGGLSLRRWRPAVTVVGPCLIRSVDASGQPVLRLGAPLLDDAYVDFVAGPLVLFNLAGFLLTQPELPPRSKETSQQPCIEPVAKSARLPGLILLFDTAEDQPRESGLARWVRISQQTWIRPRGGLSTDLQRTRIRLQGNSRVAYRNAAGAIGSHDFSGGKYEPREPYLGSPRYLPRSGAVLSTPIIRSVQCPLLA